ncbi:hypothetical protein [Pseudogemmobacter faecipullorum]|uniref:Minor tail protein n=1 Tax=Pseudogemmobacter faecipullorum TaxID=2755041 RepID=A0ABS8CQY0_9RHOB|nr:hypothetical protein [Pseudogemmobacter faecipullorum]MCB5411773.1 hypothetical protein [Pseudogemmobacter faecipullorum]
MSFPPTDWGGWTPEEYEVGAAATSGHFERWFRNVVALAQGAPNAPRITGEALATDNEGLEVLAVVASDAHEIAYGARPVAGVSSTSSTSFVMAKRWTIKTFSGSVRLKFQHAGSTSSGTATVYSRVMINGAEVAAWTVSTGGAGANRSVDLDIDPDDVIELQTRVSGSAATGSTSDIILSASNAYTPVSAYRRAAL